MKRTAIGALAGLALLLAGCGKGASDAPATFTMSGTLSLSMAATEPLGGSSCAGKGGYDDLREGAPVVVYDGAAKAVAVGSVSVSMWDETTRGCILGWSVKDVPGGLGIYSYEVSHRGKMTISEDTARAGHLGSSIGD